MLDPTLAQSMKAIVIELSMDDVEQHKSETPETETTSTAEKQEEPGDGKNVAVSDRSRHCGVTKPIVLCRNETLSCLK